MCLDKDFALINFNKNYTLKKYKKQVLCSTNTNKSIKVGLEEFILKITSDNDSLAENKVLILYTLARSQKPVTNDALYSIIRNAVDLNYFYFQQFLIDLIDSKYINCYESQTQNIYSLTEEGKNTLDLTLDLLPGIVKLKVDTNFKNDIESLNNAHSIVSEFTPISENRFEVTCKIVENNETIFEVKTIAFSRDQAQVIVDNWKKNASTLYPKLLEDLTK